MKALLLFLMMFGKSPDADSQIKAIVTNGFSNPDSTTEFFIQNTPTNLWPNRRWIQKMKDSTLIRWIYPQVRWDKYPGSRDDGAITSIVWMDNLGYMKRSPLSQLQIPSSAITSPPWMLNSSPAGSITPTNISNWNTAFGWGNHATAGYLTSESDPIWTAASGNYWTKTQADARYLKMTDTIPGVIMTTAAANSAISGINSTVSGKADKSTTITINGVSQNLSTNRTWSVGDILSSGSYSNPSWLTLSKAFVGLGNVDNTSDLAKPVSTATQTALNGKFNSPAGTTSQYIRGDGSLFTFPSIPAQLNLSAGTGISVTGSYPNLTVTNTSAVTPTITAGNGVVITGTWPNLTISTAPPTIATPSRVVNTNFTPSATKYSIVVYSVLCSVTNPLLLGSSSATAFLEYSTNGGSSWLPANQIGNSSGVALTVTVAITNGQTGGLVGIIPANALVRVRSVTTGTASVSITSSTEVTF